MRTKESFSSLGSNSANESSFGNPNSEWQVSDSEWKYENSSFSSRFQQTKESIADYFGIPPDSNEAADLTQEFFDDKADRTRRDMGARAIEATSRIENESTLQYAQEAMQLMNQYETEALSSDSWQLPAGESAFEEIENLQEAPYEPEDLQKDEYDKSKVESMKSNIVRAEKVSQDLQGYLASQEKDRTAQERESIYESAIESGRYSEDIVSNERMNDLRQSPYEQARLTGDNTQGIREGEVFNNDGMPSIEREAHRADLHNRFMQSTEQRRGTELIDDNGVERRPIVDISIESDDQDSIAKSVSQRSQAYVAARDKLSAILSSGETVKYEEVKELLVSEGVIHAEQMRGVNPEGVSEAGTVADLYISAEDIENAREIDRLRNEIFKGKGFTESDEIYDNIQKRATTFIANMIPSGVEMFHATDENGVRGILGQGGLAPRSQYKHGTDARVAMQGGLVHWAGLGTYAHTYGDKVIGIPIDAIIEKTPYMQPETVFQGASLDDEGYTQEKMGGITINDIDSMPDMMRQRLETMQKNIDTYGLQGLTVNGEFDNFAFAASSEEGVASQYEYSIDDMTIYTSSSSDSDLAKDIVAASDNIQVREVTRDSSHRRESSMPNSTDVYLEGASINNFNIKNGMKVYVPLSESKTRFSESKMASAYRREINLDGIVDGMKHSYVGELLDQSSDDPREVINEAFLEIGRESARARLEGGEDASYETKVEMEADLFSSYIRNYSDAVAEKANPESIISRLSPDVVSYAIGLRSSHGDGFKSVDQSHKKELLNAIAERAGSTGDPGWWADFSAAEGRYVSKDMLEELGFVPSDEQKQAFDESVRVKPSERAVSPLPTGGGPSGFGGGPPGFGGGPSGFGGGLI